MNNIRKMLVLMMVLAVLSPVVISTASATYTATPMKIQSNNLYTLNTFTNNGAWYNVGANSYLLKWYYGGGEKFEPGFKAPAYYGGIITATTMADYTGREWGQCVSMVKNLAHSTTQTKDWYAGVNVVASGNIPQGTVIATFSNWDGRPIYKNYYPNPDHAAIFREYIRNSNNQIIGIMVWDQNFVKTKLVGMHVIPTSGSGRNDADKYYVVQT